MPGPGRAAAGQTGLPYHEVGVFRSYAEVVIHLYRTTKAYQRALAPAR